MTCLCVSGGRLGGGGGGGMYNPLYTCTNDNKVLTKV